MAASSIQADCDRIADLMRGRLGLRARDFQRAVKKGRGQLPRSVRAEAERLAEAQRMAENPRLALTLERDSLNGAARRVIDHLEGIDAADARRTRLINWAVPVVINQLILAALLLGFLAWRGLI